MLETKRQKTTLSVPLPLIYISGSNFNLVLILSSEVSIIRISRANLLGKSSSTLKKLNRISVKRKIHHRSLTSIAYFCKLLGMYFSGMAYLLVMNKARGSG